MINFLVNDEATPELQRILRGVTNRRPLMQRLGKMLEVNLRKHFATREKDSPNKQGFTRQHFWSDVRDRTALLFADNDTATVAVAHPALALKIHGGTVRPRDARALAIPINNTVYGVRARNCQIPGLFVYRNKNSGKAFLAASDGTRLTLYYALVKQTVHAPDPRALPDMNLLEKQLCARAAELLRQTKQ